ncbi:S9 family peptidase [Micromonospora sp. Llam7]|uniref:alpha/beta hydrolase family protein n=1 Tax=Micromonospora tarapacensis TaxID=2835305 RepID=UPI001C833CAE|nr:S9 family peptidase [Micromonospora tarapacensis]
MDDSSGQFNVVVQNVEDGCRRVLTTHRESAVRKVAWSRNGDRVVYLADRNGDERTQIYQVPAGGGEPVQLTDAPGVQHEFGAGNPFSPVGDLLAYTANDRDPARKDVLVLNVDTGEVRRVHLGGGGTHVGHWSPDGRLLTVVDWLDSSNHRVHLLSVADADARQISPADRAARYVLGPWLPDGSACYVLSNLGRDYMALARMDAASGALEWLDTPDWNVEEVAVAPGGGTVLWTVNEEGSSELRCRRGRGEAAVVLPGSRMGELNNLTLDPPGRCAVMLGSTPTRPWNVAVLELTSGDLRWLTDVDPPAARASVLAEPTLVHVPCRAGHRVPAHLYRPPGRREPVGVVLSVHGGPMSQERPVYQYDGFYQFLLSRGLAVFAPNVRGSSGYGRAYQESVYRDWGGVDLDDLADAVRYLREQSWVDRSRVGLFGGSYGGFLVLSCLARLADLGWAAGVSYCAPSNLVTLAEATPPAWRSQVLAVIGDPVADAPRLLDRSPVTHADKIRAPLFVIQGANDPRVPRSESDQIVERLRDRGVRVRYDVYSDEGHGFLKRENQARMRSSAGDFLAAHLVP